MLRCPVCEEIFRNDYDLYKHMTNFESVVSQHALYIEKVENMLYAFFKNNAQYSVTMTDVIKYLVRKKMYTTENHIFKFVRKKYTTCDKFLLGFYKLPSSPFRFVNRDEIKTKIKENIPKILKNLGYGKCHYGQCNKDSVSFLPVDGNMDNLLISNINGGHCADVVVNFENTYPRRKQTIVKEFQFDSSHFLYDYSGKCRYPHGHTYKLKVFIERPIQNDMVMDFGDLNQIVKDKVISVLDHQNLNDILDGLNSTSENIILWIWRNLELGGLKGISKLELSETPTSTTILTKEQLMDDDYYLCYLLFLSEYYD